MVKLVAKDHVFDRCSPEVPLHSS